jgi:hypothetical protein
MPPDYGVPLSKPRSIALITLCILAAGSMRAHCEEVVKTTICQVIADPPAFNHKLIELSGYASEGMEQFSLSTRGCHVPKDNLTGIWLEYGGRLKSGAKYCCGVSTARTRPNDLVIDGMTTAVIEDDNFRAFDAQVYPTGTAKVTLVGRFFAGTRQDSAPGLGMHLWGGYGHFGMFTLLVIQQVVSVSVPPKTPITR